MNGEYSGWEELSPEVFRRKRTDPGSSQFLEEEIFYAGLAVNTWEYLSRNGLRLA